MYHDLVNRIVPNVKSYSRKPVLVCRYVAKMARRVGDKEVYISEYVVAKILGYLPHLSGHPEITKAFLLFLPEHLKQPRKILMKLDRSRERYLICGVPEARIVLEIKREGAFTQVSTIHLIRRKNLDKLEERCISL